MAVRRRQAGAAARAREVLALRRAVAAAEALRPCQRQLVLALGDEVLLGLAADLRGGSSASRVAGQWGGRGVTYNQVRHLWRALGLPKVMRAQYGTSRLHAAELAVTCDPDRLPAVPGRIMALLACEPDDVRAAALAAWQRLG